MKSLCALILAAGKGTRMVSNRAKVLHEVCGEPMLRMVYRTAARIAPEEIFVVIGQDADLVRRVLEGYPARFVLQKSQLGTGHAVLSASEELRQREGNVLILSGDTPRIKTSTLQKIVDHHFKSGAATTILTTQPPEPFGYGRILRAQDGRITRIVEEKDATPEQKRIREINAALYCCDIPLLLDALSKLSSDNAQKEYYLTDVVEIQSREGRMVEAVLHEDAEELQGINNRRELALISKELWREKCRDLMTSGVTIIDPDQTYIDPGVQIEKDAIIHPHVHLEGETIIGENTVVNPGSRIRNSTIGGGVEIMDSSVIFDSVVGNNSKIGPNAHLRNKTMIGSDCRIGNFVEITRSSIGDRTMACHLSYLGDAIVGADVNIGAGAVTCNYDGVQKNVTIIEDHAFIGTNAQLVAPVRIGKGSFVAAGSCITLDVPADSMAIARKRQTNKPHWVLKGSRKKR